MTTTNEADRLEFPNPADGVTSLVVRHLTGGWFVTLFDTDARAYLGSGRIYPADRFDDAVAYARKLAGLAPSTGTVSALL